jgi:hypothetical protein
MEFLRSTMSASNLPVSNQKLKHYTIIRGLDFGLPDNLLNTQKLILAARNNGATTFGRMSFRRITLRYRYIVRRTPAK